MRGNTGKLFSMNLMRSARKPKVDHTVEVKPYDKLALYYDAVMEHVDYDTWAKYAVNLHRLFRMNLSEVTDLACGTGTLALKLAEWGLNVVGVDGDPRMIDVARAKHLPNGRQARFYVGDLRDKLPEYDQDLVLCLYDSMNYLLDAAHVVQFFRRVRPALRDEGLFIVDCSTESNSLTHFSNMDQTERLKGVVVSRRAWYDPAERIQNNSFEIYPKGENTVYLEHHQQRIWRVNDIVEMLQQAGFKCLAKYDGYTFKQGGERSDRVHFVAKPA